MYDFHTHSLLSDGCLLPSELARRYEEKGYKAIAITDHVDISNIKRVVCEIETFCKNWPKKRIKVLPGIELTHVPLEQFSKLAKYARKHGIKIIVAHGESPVEPVIKGTNKAALNSDIDILAHPGKISKEEVLLAKKKNIFLEVTARKGHRQTNSHVIKMARIYGANLILNTDSHSPENIPTPAALKQLGIKAGLSPKELAIIYRNLQKIFLNT
ncbi:MAG: histidinol phosphate phosphatase domain-containing protein [Candidatus Omnitrophica bacterium]|nr:histidinol phosphate phosphatase domain-containing protein [Candidatus Omnitrophota bacterium]